MSSFTVQATLIHPEHRERAVAVDLLVDTGGEVRIRFGGRERGRERRGGRR